MIPEDTLPTNIYISSYLSHCTVQYSTQSVSLMAEAQQDSCMLTASRLAH